MRKTSTVVSFSHFIWAFLTEVAEAVLRITIPQYVKFLLVVALSLATAAILIRLSEKPKFKVLKYFY